MSACVGRYMPIFSPRSFCARPRPSAPVCIHVRACVRVVVRLRACGCVWVRVCVRVCVHVCARTGWARRRSESTSQASPRTRDARIRHPTRRRNSAPTVAAAAPS
eukprot:1751216-Pleurochrysis_carterae.AAC.3